ncbi:ATPase AAA [Paraburkholderia caribensis]|uniref:hypothetical protein n=1 Tax=Paraburkholderia caribensis TaxID=75105 RepID=UPI001CABA5AB|nr:hypothetical protein [Paraburkholderia caribensis]CAG9236602.1 ATPase AAA [Paraburkholderia caribensis]
MNYDEMVKDRKVLPLEKRERLQKVLNDTLVMHRNIGRAFDELNEIIQLGKPGQLVVLSGPTNVGKTRLVKAMDQMLVAEARAKGLPLWGSTYCRLPSPVRARFDHGETYRRTLCSLEEPLIDRKVEYPNVCDGALPRRAMPHFRRPPTHAALWQALMNRIRAGHLAVFFDEAGELPQSLKVTTLRETVNVFKQMADVGGACVVLVSGPEIGPILWESGQLAARIKLVGLDPYEACAAGDVTVFCNALAKVEQALGEDFIVPGTLNKANVRTMMGKVRGTFGIALDILVYAVHSSLMAGTAPLRWERLAFAIERRMEQIGSQVDREQAFWAAIKDERLRGKYWGVRTAAGYLGTGLILPTAVPQCDIETGKASGDRGPSASSGKSRQTNGHAPRRGMHQARPKRVPLDEYSEETVKEGA